MAKSEKIIPTQITFVDIAGLIKGASKGEGLGNQFLGHIRSVDAVAHVVRCFDDPNIIHVEGSINPLRDIETIDTELVLSDLDSILKLFQKIEKGVKAGEKDAKIKYETAKELEAHLSSGKPARSFACSDEVLRAELLAPLLTAKPTLFVANVAEGEVNHIPQLNGSHPIDKVYAHAQSHGAEMVIISGQVEAEIAELPTEERTSYLQELGFTSSGLDRLALTGYKLLNLLTFFTVGPKETHAWTVTQGTKCPQAAGKIHSDFERGFIRAEIIGYDDFLTAGGEVKAKEAGKLRIEGKEYIMQDGDIVHFRFNV